MRVMTLALAAYLSLTASALAQDRKGIRFWNLTSATVNKLHLSAPGQNAWGPNQCLNDKDGEVDHRERLTLKDVQPGKYDVQLGYANGRMCVVREVEIKDGAVFSIEDKQLKECTKG